VKLAIFALCDAIVLEMIGSMTIINIVLYCFCVLHDAKHDLLVIAKVLVTISASVVFSAVTIIVVTIFIAIFQNYRIFIAIFSVRAERYICAALALCKHDRFTTSLVVYSSFSTLQSRAANDVTRVIAARRPWLSSVSVPERRRNCL